MPQIQCVRVCLQGYLFFVAWININILSELGNKNSFCVKKSVFQSFPRQHVNVLHAWLDKQPTLTESC